MAYLHPDKHVSVRRILVRARPQPKPAPSPGLIQTLAAHVFAQRQSARGPQ